MLLEVAELACNQGVFQCTAWPLHSKEQQKPQSARSGQLRERGRHGTCPALVELQHAAVRLRTRQQGSMERSGPQFCEGTTIRLQLQGTEGLYPAHAELGFEAGQASTRDHALNLCTNSLCQGHPRRG